jgi:diguanylate cyclase (GGDEF)-like protein/PAS domain S-box-containing protein
MKRPSALIPVIAGFSVMLILMVALTAIGLTYVRQLSNQLTAIVSERNEKAELATAMRALHEARHHSLMLSSTLQDPFVRDEEIMRFFAMAREFIGLRDKFLGLPLDETELPLWQQIRGNVVRVEATSADIIGLLQKDQLDEASALIRRQLLPTQESMMRDWGQLVTLQRSKNQAALLEARKASDEAQRLTVALSAGAFLVGLIIAVFVIRLSRRLEKDLFEEKERAQITLQAIGDAVVRFDQDHKICYLNPVAERLLGFTQASASGQPIEKVLPIFEKETRSELTLPLVNDTYAGAYSRLPETACLLSVHGMEYEIEGSCAPIHTSEGDIMGGVLVLRDVTEARAMQQKLQWQAEHDELTGLTNRRAFEQRVSRCLNSKRASEHPMSLIYLDLDHFKPINDTAGHAAGDELLRQVSHLMLTRIRDSDTLARMGGDEFCILLTACPQDMAERIAEVIRASLEHLEFTWEDKTYRIGTSVGIVHVTSAFSTFEECMAAADAACYEAKNNGRGNVVVHQR